MEGNKKNASPVRKKSAHCYRCGSTSHMANNASCPAKNAKCKSCAKTGHFAKVCKSKEKTVNELAVPEVTVLSVPHNSATQVKLTCTVEITAQNNQSCVLDLLIDTGSAVSILPEYVYKTKFCKCPLTKPRLQLVTYSKEKLSVSGCLKVDVSYQKTTASSEMYIVESGTPILGMDLVTTLNLQISGGQLLPGNQPTCAMLQSAAEAVVESSTDSVEPSTYFGCAKGFVHKVKIRPEVRPVQQKLRRRLPLSVCDAVSAELRYLEQHWIIENIDSSEWVSPIVVNQKKTGGIRMCVDLREPNKAVVVDSYPLRLIEDILAELRGAVLFSTLDLKHAYHQVELHTDSRDLTAFVTHDGLYRYKRVPYGLSSAPSAFQKMMCTILQGLKGVQCYLDDVIIFGSTQQEHNENLKAVLQKIHQSGLKLNAEKCHLNRLNCSF